jgi:hypothetical protein
MDNTPRARPSPLSPASNSSLNVVRFLLVIFFAALILAGCASPGEPTERRPPTPQTVADLAATQLGNSVLLTFTLPKETVEGHPLAQPPAIEVFRDFAPAPSSATGNIAPPAVPAQPTLVVTIPSAMVDGYVTQGLVRYADSVKPEDFVQHPDSIAIYTVRTRASAKRDSANSNPAALRVYPAPDPVGDLKGEVTHSGIALTWTAPQKISVGSAPPIMGYHVYRSESQPSAPANPGAATAQKQNAEPAARQLRIGETNSPGYLDAQVETGNTYAYSVRSVVQYGTVSLESADSNPLTIIARDTFPPATPQGLVVVDVLAQGEAPAHIEISWAISPETDLAGYNVYRSEQTGALGTRLNAELLLTPAFRDMNAVPGRRYFYSVTAVDRSGNESPASAAVSGTVPVESQPNP